MALPESDRQSKVPKLFAQPFKVYVVSIVTKSRHLQLIADKRYSPSVAADTQVFRYKAASICRFRSPEMPREAP